MRDIHGFETRENCFGETPYEGYGPDEVDDPTAEEMADEYEAEGIKHMSVESCGCKTGVGRGGLLAKEYADSAYVVQCPLHRAAPELLEALKSIASVEADKIGWRGGNKFIDGKWIECPNDSFSCEFCHAPFNVDPSAIEHEASCMVVVARAAIAKAEGRSE